MCGGTCVTFGCDSCAKSIVAAKHGWIECMSTTFPGKVYYFHTSTRCSTWQRPVPRNVTLPRYKKFRESNPADSLTNDEVLPSGLSVSSTKHSIFSGDPPSAFEMHARRMQIYLEKNTDHCSSEALRDKLIESYKNAKAELAKKLDEKRRMKQPRSVAEKPKPKPRTLQASVRTIRECNGIKTISYDNVPRELPAGVKCCDLSESTSDSNFFPGPRCERSSVTDKSLIPPGQGRDEDGISGHNRRFADLTFKDLNLSDTENTESGFGSA
ncbi:uncharacterized protein LOC124185163 isoform X1 [Neodiprion fabricii]|uniref:uncharacterized protein LOC124185163 isoform X1 n=1 Tax=Neodiprion fabricii TaxID=2872261 RepID=UPI001ED8FAA0|nr:uncharacterized protein LOC124185163 isoform X1 [Neodiprion fabricii]